MRQIGRHFRGNLASGFLLIIPLAVTIIIMTFVWDFLQAQLNPLLDRIPGPISGFALDIIAVVALLLLIYLLGLIGRTLIGGRLVRFGESALDRIPVVRPIYRVARQTAQVLAGGTELQSTKIVLLEYPRPGVLSLGLVTGQYVDPTGETLITVYIPTIPNPTSGFLAIVRKEQIIETDLSYEDAMKIVLSAGVLSKEVTQAHEVPGAS